jgi:topoisomerase-4 subunit A
MNLREVLREWLATAARCCSAARATASAIERRLELLGGFLIAYLNLDEVIRIIREEDEPKLELMKTFELTDVQAEAILNMRCVRCASSRSWKSARSTTA